MEKKKIARIAGKRFDEDITAAGYRAYHIAYNNGDNSTINYSFIVESVKSPYEWLRENQVALSEEFQGGKVPALIQKIAETGKPAAALDYEQGADGTDFFWRFRATAKLRSGFPEVWGGCPKNVWLNFE